MNAAQHYREAEKCLERARDADARFWHGEARIHVGLALVAAVAAGGPDAATWAEVLEESK